MIVAEGVSKRYLLGSQSGRPDNLLDKAASSLRGALSRKPGQEFWALTDVGFTIDRGEAVGVIGRNGAGKSTLLKILSQITPPTSGKITLRGRVASLLEVGTGFHPELTGRENIYLNGAVLGMRKREIDEKFDQIVDFSEVETFLDTPVKRYSSGMYVRLAFAVAAHLDPEILVVDEVLAVGDAQFQRKCLGKMKDVAALGRTVLFVSHSMQAISALTQKCVVLNAGRTEFVGDTAEAIRRYLVQGASSEAEYVAEASSSVPNITSVKLETSYPNSVQGHGDLMTVTLDFQTPFPITGCRINVKAQDSYGAVAFQAWCHHTEEKPLGDAAGPHRVVLTFPKCRLFQGGHSLKVHLSAAYGREHYEVLESVCPFDVEMMSMTRDGGWLNNESIYIDDYEWTSCR